MDGSCLFGQFVGKYTIVPLSLWEFQSLSKTHRTLQWVNEPVDKRRGVFFGSSKIDTFEGVRILGVLTFTIKINHPYRYLYTVYIYI